MGPSLVPGLPKMYSTPSALSISNRACLPVIIWDMDASHGVLPGGESGGQPEYQAILQQSASRSALYDHARDNRGALAAVTFRLTPP